MEVLPQTVPVVAEQSPAVQSKNEGPLPMSFPAILRNPGLSDRFAHLRGIAAESRVSAVPTAPKKNRRDEKEGKRWVRRRENARLAGNAHIVQPTKNDYGVPVPSKYPTFPQPLPKYLSRNNSVPPATLPAREPNSANAGRFSLSLKGMRRELRKSGPRTEQLVKEVEREILAWMHDDRAMLSPDTLTEVHFPGVSIGSEDAIREVSRTPLQLVWAITDDSFTRYVVHCCARYHEVVSFSKDTSGQRLTYLLRPNVIRPSFYASAGPDTPPMTDLESSVSAYELDSESDFAGVDSDMDGEPAVRTSSHLLAAIVETSAPSTPNLVSAPLTSASDDEWSVVADGDADAENDSDAGDGISTSVASLAISGGEVDLTPRAELRPRQASLRSHLWERQRRSASSPSRSPARRMTPRMYRVDPPRAVPLGRRSFHDYLYA